MKKLSESVWSDIHKRSNGETVRKEDNVDLLSPEDFVTYLKTHYRVDNSPYDFMFSEIANTISLPIYVYINIEKRIQRARMLYFSYNDHCAYVSHDIKKYAPKLYSKLENDFDLWDDDPDYKYYIIINPLDEDRTPNNSYVLELLEYIIKNIDKDLTQVLSKKSKIDESVWSDIHRRSNGTQERTEDIKTNIKNLVPVDMGVSVLWADQDLEFKDGDVFFTYNEAIDCIKNSDWRLPTRKEYNELTAKTQLLVNTDYEYSCQGKGVTGTDLHFYKKGLKYASDKVYHSEKYYSWTSSKVTQENDTYFVNVFKEYQAMQPMHYLNKFCVRLVKDIK